ncbi:type VI secretion system Vgr family protein [Luteimonas abyssi]|uniref:type VI secretion system Vgr family protein n=1 Tax=Luteimonas abyssi TaxID=1247514 RepID=UPI000737CA13|nr:type VI secretion system Vgr family protein [Luteimonas abyssi]
MDVIATLLTTLQAAPGQRERLLRLHTPLGPDVLVAEALQGHERLDGGGFRLEIAALSVDAHLDLDALLGRPVLLELLTADSSTDLRPFHGHVTAFEQLGSNGGLARYRLVVEPWLAFLRQRVDSYVFQDKSVVEIVEDVFADYVDAGALAPAWRWDLDDASVYPKRSLTTQYQEDDFAFVERLLADEGLFYWFEHSGAAGDDALGTHTLVIADHNGAAADLGSVRYHRADATERDDSLQQWSPARRLHTGRIQRASWDYRSLGLRPASAEADVPGDVIAEDIDTAGPYAWVDSAHGDRLARRQIEGLQAAGRMGTGGGSWRRLAPGGRFTVTQHPQAGDGEHLCVRVDHVARNNLGAEIFDTLEQTLGPIALPGLALPESLGGSATATPHALEPLSRKRERGRGEGSSSAASADSEADFYRNHFHTLPADIAYRPRTRDGHGTRLHPKPTVYGTQSAIVVSDGAPLTTDRDDRIKVQFAWQRGGDASGGQAHPAGDDNAPGTDGAWTWVRVATPWAGDNWGGVLLPRKGQEVLVAFLEGDIDRPVVVGSLYNGRGQDDAAHNQIAGGGGGATGNAAAWFDGNDHAAVFTGFKSQALADSQTGSGGYQQLRLDDTPGQGRAQASTTQHATTLTLGHIKGGEDNVRETERGFGAELSTQASGAIRAGQGLLLTTESGAQHLTATDGLAQLDAGTQLLQALADTAKSQEAILPDDGDTLPAQDSLTQLQDALKATQQGSAGGGEGDSAIGGGEGEVPGWSAPHLLGSSPDGVMSLTPADQAWVSGTQTTLTANGDLDWASQAGTVIAAGGGIALFTQGGDAPGGKPNQETGIALHAAQGKASARAHKNEAKVAAKTKITVASTQSGVEIAAPSKHVLLTAQGAYLKIEGGNIELGAPGVVEFKGSSREFTGPRSASGQAPTLGGGDLSACEFKSRGADAAGEAVVVGG